MKKLVLLALLLSLLLFPVLCDQPHSNGLFIVADDLAKTLPCYGYTKA